MNRVLVLDKNRKPLMPCHPARARELLRNKRARVFRRAPFTIILKQREGGDLQPVEYKVDPGSKKTGISLGGDFKRGKRVIFAINLEHRGFTIKTSLDSRRAIRRSRRQRKTRYREPRFDNRRRPQGWLAPSLMSRVNNVSNWTKKLMNLCPLTSIAVETVRFDMQKIQNPEISGIEYQQGELFGYELREYLLEKWKRRCAYCDRKNVPLEIEHIVPKSKGGTNRVSNLTLACTKCNIKKGNDSIESFVKDKERLKKILAQAKSPLKDAAAVNATRYATGNALKSFGLPISFWSGGRTKYNRVTQGYNKDHWIDAACVGETGANVYIPPNFISLEVKAEGRGSRQKCRVDRYGFPRTGPKSQKRVKGFQTGDLAKAVVPQGKKKGTYVGRVAIRKRGIFNIKVGKKVINDIHYKYCRLLQHVDGYSYAYAR
jgi:5-methylcytosine-specific restriction endonuclease McrA